MVQLPSNAFTSEAVVQPSSDVAGLDGLAAVCESERPAWDMLDEEWLSDEPDLESDFHREQIYLLLQLLKYYWRNRNDVYCSGNTSVYYDPEQLTTRNFNGPDVYVVLGVEPRPRNSWMVWREGGRFPNVVIELLSDSTAKVDRTTKKELYQNVWQVPEYFWFHPRTYEFKGFRLVDGQYEAIEANDAEHLWSEELGLFFGVRDGVLRLFLADGTLVLGKAEDEEIQRIRAQQEAQQERALRGQAEQEAQQERLLKEQEQQKVERLTARLRELEVDLDDLGY
jgi:Uma2 family endonuclease